MIENPEAKLLNLKINVTCKKYIYNINNLAEQFIPMLN